MADITGASGFTSGQSFSSLMNRLPTKRLDAKFAAAAAASAPEQGEQTGGYSAGYAHLSHLPLFPLYSEKQQKLMTQKQALKDRMVQDMDDADPDKKLTGGQKTFMGVLANLSGGANPVSAKRWERRLIGMNVASMNMSIEQSMLAIFTRWTVPNSPEGIWFVDVFKSLFLDPDRKLAKLSGKGGVSLKAGTDTKSTLKLLGNNSGVLKSQKFVTVRSKLANHEQCDTIAVVGEDGREVEMQIVARIQRTCSTTEMAELQIRFQKEWAVPVL